MLLRFEEPIGEAVLEPSEPIGAEMISSAVWRNMTMSRIEHPLSVIIGVYIGISSGWCVTPSAQGNRSRARYTAWWYTAVVEAALVSGLLLGGCRISCFLCGIR